MTATARAHLALIVSGLLYGANYWVAKGLMPGFMQPMQIIFIRGFTSLILLWLFAFFINDRHVEKRDHLILAACGLTGIAINQTFFFLGLNLTSPVDAALIHSGSPVIVLLFSVLIAGEKAGWSKIAGIAIGAFGAVLLVLMGNFNNGGNNHLLGNMLILFNIVSYSLYLVMVKPLWAKYKALTIMKWVFLYGFIFIFPFCINGIGDLSFSSFTPYAWFAISYIVIGTPFFSYLLTTYSLKTLSAGTAGYYIYMQPVIAASIGIIFFKESPALIKIIAAIMVFTGVFLVNRNPSIRKGAEKV